MEVAAGKTYYLQQSESAGLKRPRVKLALLNENAGKEALEACKQYTRFNEAGETKAAEIVAKKYKAALKKIEG